MARFRAFLVPPPKGIENFSNACVETKLLNIFLGRMVMSTHCFFHKGSLPSKTGLRRLRSKVFLYTSTLNMAVGSMRYSFDSQRLKRNLLNQMFLTGKNL